MFVSALGRAGQMGLRNTGYASRLHEVKITSTNTFIPPAASQNSYTNTLVVPSGRTNALLFVGINIRGNNPTTNMSYGGIQLTLLATNNSTSSHRTEMWYMPNPPAGSASLINGYNGSVATIVGAFTCSGVSQRVPFGTISTTNNTSQIVTIFTTNSLNEISVNSFTIFSATTQNATNIFGLQRWQQYFTGNILGCGGTVPTTQNVTSNRWDVNVSQVWNALSAPIKPH